LIAEPPNFFFGVARNFAVIHVGAPTAGMNCVTHAFVRIANHSKYNVLGVEQSWEGLAEGRFKTCNSLGTDTALNEICRQVDNIQLSAKGTRKRAVIIETMGERCGFLPVMTALATGAEKALVFQQECSDRDLKKMAQHAAVKAKRGLNQYTVVRSDGADDKISCDEIKSYFEEYEDQQLPARVNILCHAQMGGAPSAFDRQMGLRMAIYAFQGLKQPKRMGDHDCCVLGLVGRNLKFTSVLELAKETCFVHRLPLSQWWMCLLPLASELSVTQQAPHLRIVHQTLRSTNKLAITEHLAMEQSVRLAYGIGLAILSLAFFTLYLPVLVRKAQILIANRRRILQGKKIEGSRSRQREEVTVLDHGCRTSPRVGGVAKVMSQMRGKTNLALANGYVIIEKTTTFVLPNGHKFEDSARNVQCCTVVEDTKN
ncbi:Phosphofructokinase, partial [Teladorsagia circumcincta]